MNWQYFFLNADGAAMVLQHTASGDGAAEAKGRLNNTLTDLHRGHGILGEHTAKCPGLAGQL